MHRKGDRVQFCLPVMTDDTIEHGSGAELPKPNEIARKLRKLRYFVGVRSQQELADKTGISRSSIAKIEAGGHALRPAELRAALAKGLGVTAEHFDAYLCGKLSLEQVAVHAGYERLGKGTLSFEDSNDTLWQDPLTSRLEDALIRAFRNGNFRLKNLDHVRSIMPSLAAQPNESALATDDSISSLVQTLLKISHSIPADTEDKLRPETKAVYLLLMAFVELDLQLRARKEDASLVLLKQEHDRASIHARINDEQKMTYEMLEVLISLDLFDLDSFLGVPTQVWLRVARYVSIPGEGGKFEGVHQALGPWRNNPAGLHVLLKEELRKLVPPEEEIPF